MPQLENIKTTAKRLWSTADTKRLWKAADTLRANSSFASNEYFQPVMGLVFLRHAYSRYLEVKASIEDKLPTRDGRTRGLIKEDFSQRGAIFLRPEAQFDALVALPDRTDRAKAIIKAMESIEADYSNLRGTLPKNEYQKLSNEVLGQLLRILNPDVLKNVSGDVFGRIYEYFLTRFADQKAHDGGEFFTPVSLVSLIAQVLDPDRGTVLDPACGSGGMFVQSAHIVEAHGQRPADRLTFRGLEKNETTIHLTKMNLAVHGLEGDIKSANTYYKDPHELHGKADFVMANPPFNVDEIDADKIKSDPRLPFGLPGVNKKGKVGNGNYIWISYFYSYLNEKGRAGFVMSSQASSAGGGEAKVRQSLVETGAVDIMIAIRSNFFYTRTVPCELWFLSRARPKQHRDKVLMIDARNLYRKVTRKIYDFSPEQQQNLLAIVWLYRGQTDKFLDLVDGYCQRTLETAANCFSANNEKGEIIRLVPDFIAALNILNDAMQPFLKTVTENVALADAQKELAAAQTAFIADAEAIQKAVTQQQSTWHRQKKTNHALKQTIERISPLSEASHTLIEKINLLYNFADNLITTCENEGDAKSSGVWNRRDVTRALKAVNDARQQVHNRFEPKDVQDSRYLEDARYFWRQAHWLTEHFPDARLRAVEGLVKLVERREIAANDWSLTPGRYVGVAPAEEDENFDFEEAMRDLHTELKELNTEAVALAATIDKNFEELGI